MFRFTSRARSNPTVLISIKHTDIIPPIQYFFDLRSFVDEARAIAAGDETVAFYARYGNPTLRAVEERIAALCEGEDALVVASGHGGDFARAICNF
jgi:O-acetylhomoserine/O-acetylserine sulfhydrylase-like pyridoxal-dependent enzyme